MTELQNGNTMISERTKTSSVKDSPLERLSRKKKKKINKQKRRDNASVLEPPVDVSSKELETAENNEVLRWTGKRKKRRRPRKRHHTLENNDLQEHTLVMQNSSLEGESCLQLPVICYEMDSVAECNAEGSLPEEKNKGKGNDKRYNAQFTADVNPSQEKNKGKELNVENNDIGHDIQKAGDMPCPDLKSIKHIPKEDLGSVSEVGELESTRINKTCEMTGVHSLIIEGFISVPKNSDTCSTKNCDDHTEVDENSLENIKTYRRRKRVKTYRRKRRKFSDSLENSLEPIEEDGSSSPMQAVQSSSTRETSFNCSDEGTTLQVVDDISKEEASVNGSDDEPAFEGSKKKQKVKNAKETCNEDGFVEDVSIRNVSQENFEQANKNKLDKVQIAVQDGIHMEEIIDESTMYCMEKVSDNPSGCDSLCKHLEQKNVDIELKMEEIIPSSSHLGAKKDGVDLVVINNEDGSPQVSYSSPERALIGSSKKKLLILDVNGLLADIVPYVPDGYKPDIMIAKKAVFKRPFCEEFLKFCFERFDVGVWSSRTKRNVDRVIDFLMGDSKHNLLFCWDQSHCTDTGFNTIENRDKPLVLKELIKLWEKQEPDLPWEKGVYNESNTLLLDDSPYKALRNPAHTAIFPNTYRYKDIKDCSLGPGGDLRVYLEGLVMAENVQRYVEQYPFGQRAITESNLSWGFYRRIVGIDSDELKDGARNSSTHQ